MSMQDTRTPAATEYITRLKQIRHEAHLLFDEFWKLKSVCDRRPMRTGCYAWLRKHTGLSKAECHFGQFDIGMCEAVIELCKLAKAGLIEGPTPKGKSVQRRSFQFKPHCGGRESINLKRKMKHRRF